MTGRKEDVFERNIGNLVRAGALPDSDDARERFLNRLGKAPPPAPRPDGGRILAVAASFLAALAVIWSMRPGVDTSGERERPYVAPARGFAAEFIPEAAGRDGEVKLSIGSTAWSPTSPWFEVRGEVPLPDRAQIQVEIRRLEESHAGGRLTPRAGRSPTAHVEVKSGRFRTRLSGDLGFYQIRVTPLEELGRGPRWSADVHVTSKSFIRRLDRELTETLLRIRDSLRFVDEFEKVCVDQATWEKAKKGLTERAGKFVLDLQIAEQRTLYPAALREILYSVRKVGGSADSYSWKDGKLEVRTYYGKQEPIKTHRGEDFAFDRFRTYIKEAVPLAGREGVLWAIAERKRGRVVDLTFNTFLNRIANECNGAGFVELYRQAQGDYEEVEAAVRSGAVPKQ